VFNVTAGASDQASLDQFFANYISSYTTYLSSDGEPDIANITVHFNEPSMQVPLRGAPRVSTTRAELGTGFTRFLALLKSKGATKLEWDKIQLVSLSDNTAIASNIARVLDKNGNLLEKRSSIYSLYKSPEGWKIAMSQSHDPGQTPVLR
jgi:hypothetical protein